MTHHVFLTGAKQVGKSTLLKKTLRSFDGQIGGFFTLRTCEYLRPDGLTAWAVTLCLIFFKRI